MPLNIEEEKKFEALRKNCRDLGVPSPPEIHIGFEVVDKNGDLIFEDKQRGHSWTRNFYNLLFMVVSDSNNNLFRGTFGPGQLSGLTTDNSLMKGNYRSRLNISSAGSGYTYAGQGILGLAGNADFGIVVGAGTGGFSAEDNKLGLQILHSDTTLGRLSYNNQAAPELVYDNTPGAEKWTGFQKRTFNNNAGGVVEITETGLYSKSDACSSVSTKYCMLERSLLSPSILVPDGAKLTVTYEISMDFSTIDAV